MSAFMGLQGSQGLKGLFYPTYEESRTTCYENDYNWPLFQGCGVGSPLQTMRTLQVGRVRL